MRSGSWVIVNKATGEAVFETFSPKLVSRINAAKYEAVPVLEYLQALNARIKATGQ
jgi:hypothetical protein